MNGIDYLDVTQEDLLGKAPTNMPAVNTLTNLDDMDADQSRVLNRIRIRDYLKNIAGGAGEGIMNTLAGQDTRSTLTRAGLGSLLFGFNPMTALLGAFIGSKTPDIYSSLQGRNINPLSFIREKRAERQRERMAKASAFEREQALRELDQATSGDPVYGAGEAAGMGFGGGRTDPTDKS
tara:strand:- start:218 stop:754 length:537 start_codon:yes stop_codon:yes gene_type:complete